MGNKPIVESKPTPAAKFVKHTIELVIGNWKVWFGDKKTKLLIAEGLNEWLDYERKMALGKLIPYEKKKELNGYLITANSVFLIVKSPEKTFPHQLEIFFNIMTGLIEHHHHVFKMNDSHGAESINSKLLYHRPFEQRSFFNDDLVKLMLGKKIKSSYFDLELANLIANIKHYNYCSAIDYAGAKGPVVITLLAD
jgi:hypothetical protein